MLSIKKNPFSHLTVKERKFPSFPAREVFQKGLLKGKVLDFGCGLGKDVEYLQHKGLDVIGYDPHYFPVYPKEKFDTILCNYVLNVLLPEEQSLVLMQISELLKPSGKAYVTVRRDVKKNGFLFNPHRNATVYQCNVVLPYKSLLLTNHCEIYEYQHYTQLNKGCSFCDDSKLLTESATAYAVYKDVPGCTNEALVIPKRAMKDYFELHLKEQLALWMVVNRVQKLLTDRLSPHGFEIKLSCTFEKILPHTHIHVMPILSS